MKRRGVYRQTKALGLALVLLIAISVASVAQAPPPGPAPVETMLTRLSKILQHIEGGLSALEAPRAERLEDGIEEIVELIEGLLDTFDRPRGASEADVKRRILTLDRMLHRLIGALEEILAPAPPQRPEAHAEAVEDLRQWVNGYVEGLTAGMDPKAAERLEAAVHQMVRDLAGRIARMAAALGPEEPAHPRLEALVQQLKDLTLRLDLFIRRQFALPRR